MYHHIVSNESTSLLKIDCIGYNTDDLSCGFGPGQRDMYIIHYIISGKGVFNGQALSAGEGFLIRPGSHEYYFPDEVDPWKFLWVTSRDPAMEEIFEAYGSSAGTGIFRYGYISAVSDLTEVIKRNHNKNYKPSKMLELFLRLYNHEEGTGGDRSNADMYYDSAVNYIKSNMFKRITVSELTDILGVTQPYLYNIFMKKNGMSPKAFIDIGKIDYAKDLLGDSGLSISEISNSVGYGDPLAFSKFFKNIVGLSPTRFRQLCKKDRGSEKSE